MGIEWPKTLPLEKVTEILDKSKRRGEPAPVAAEKLNKSLYEGEPPYNERSVERYLDLYSDIAD